MTILSFESIRSGPAKEGVNIPALTSAAVAAKKKYLVKDVLIESAG